MRKKFFFSIIIPTFNSANFLARAVNSVIKQSYKKYEVIIIDNNSTDSTNSYLKTLKQKNIKIIKTNNNGIIAKSRNLGIKKAKGDWIAFLDSDDTWKKNKLKIFYNHIKKNKTDFLSSNCNLIFNNGEKKIFNNKNYKINNNILNELIIKRNFIGASSAVVNRNFLIKNNLRFNEGIKFTTVEDLDLWINIVKVGAKFFYINKQLTNHYKHNSNMSNDILHYRNLLLTLNSHIFKKKNIKMNKIIWLKIFIINILRASNFLFKKNKKTFFLLIILLLFVFSFKVFTFNIYISKKNINSIFKYL